MNIDLGGISGVSDLAKYEDVSLGLIVNADYAYVSIPRAALRVVRVFYTGLKVTLKRTYNLVNN